MVHCRGPQSLYSRDSTVRSFFEKRRVDSSIAWPSYSRLRGCLCGWSADCRSQIPQSLHDPNSSTSLENEHTRTSRTRFRLCPSATISRNGSWTSRCRQEWRTRVASRDHPTESDGVHHWISDEVRAKSTAEGANHSRESGVLRDEEGNFMLHRRSDSAVSSITLGSCARRDRWGWLCRWRRQES